MKTQLYITILALAIGLQFSSCKTTYQASVANQYPAYAELQKGNYGSTKVYSDNDRSELQAKYKAFSNLLHVESSKVQQTSIAPPVSSSLSAAAYTICTAEK